MEAVGTFYYGLRRSSHIKINAFIDAADVIRQPLIAPLPLKGPVSSDPGHGTLLAQNKLNTALGRRKAALQPTS